MINVSGRGYQLNDDDAFDQGLIALIGAEEANAMMGEILRGHGQARIMGQVRQLATGAANCRPENELRTMDGLGQCVGEIDSEIIAHWETLYPGCWRDPAFVREFLRDNPECRTVTKKKATILV